MNVYTKQKQNHKRKRQTCLPKRRGKVEGTSQRNGIDRYKPLNIKEKRNKTYCTAQGIISYNGIQSAKS